MTYSYRLIHTYMRWFFKKTKINKIFLPMRGLDLIYNNNTNNLLYDFMRIEFVDSE